MNINILQMFPGHLQNWNGNEVMAMDGGNAVFAGAKNYSIITSRNNLIFIYILCQNMTISVKTMVKL